MLIGFIIALGMSIVAYYYCERLALWTYSAQPLEGADPYNLNETLQKLCNKTGLPKPKIFVVPSQTPNAFALGRRFTNSSIVITEGLIKHLSPEEIEAVLAHELAQIQNRDTGLMAMSAALGSLVMYVAQFFKWMALFGGDGSTNRVSNVIGNFFVALFVPFAAIFVQLGFSRNRKFLADSVAADVTQKPQVLAEALWKIYNYAHAIPMAATPATAHMFIISPVENKGINRMFRSHPDVKERIKKLIGKEL